MTACPRSPGRSTMRPSRSWTSEAPRSPAGRSSCPGLLGTCKPGGHIPGASNNPWSQAVNEDGTFRTAAELGDIYEEAGISGQRPIIAYCRIGEGSSHSWSVLKYLLGFDDIKNYDGSWTEWGNLVGAEIETAAATPRARAAEM